MIPPALRGYRKRTWCGEILLFGGCHGRGGSRFHFFFPFVRARIVYRMPLGHDRLAARKEVGKPMDIQKGLAATMHRRKAQVVEEEHWK